MTDVGKPPMRADGAQPAAAVSAQPDCCYNQGSVCGTRPQPRCSIHARLSRRSGISREGGPTSRKWRNWQTHQLEGLAFARTWGFESPLSHQPSLMIKCEGCRAVAASAAEEDLIFRM
jgi:hypothetical protein